MANKLTWKCYSFVSNWHNKLIDPFQNIWFQRKRCFAVQFVNLKGRLEKCLSLSKFGIKRLFTDVFQLQHEARVTISRLEIKVRTTVYSMPEKTEHIEKYGIATVVHINWIVWSLAGDFTRKCDLNYRQYHLICRICLFWEVKERIAF